MPSLRRPRRHRRETWSLPGDGCGRYAVTPHDEMIATWKQAPTFRQEYDALADEFSLFDALVSARQPGSFSFRTWDCTTGGKRVQGFVSRGALLSRHAPHALKLCTQVDHHDSTAAAPHRGLRRDSGLSPLSGQTPSLARHS